MSIFGRLVHMLLLAALLVFLVTFSVAATELDDEEDVRELAQPVVEPGPVVVEPLPELEELAREQRRQSDAFVLFDTEVPPGEVRQLAWSVTLSSIKFNVPVIVAHGRYQGPVVGITAALHGDELNGIEIARQVLKGLDPQELAGTLVAVPIVNLEGFLKQSRYIADRRDLNRYFPGKPDGVMPARYADGLFQQVVLKCDSLIDLHTGSYYRTNLPQLRADMSNPAVATMVEQFGNLTVLHSPGVPGMLRNAASAAGIPAVTMEVGGPLALEPDEVAFGVEAIRQFLGAIGMIDAIDRAKNAQPVFYQSHWLMADADGILLAEVALGEEVDAGERLATIVNPISNAEYPVLATEDGTILGMAQNQFVSPGYVIFRVGIEQTEQEVIDEAKREATAAEEPPADTMR